jgi:Heparinase II/III-like protein
MKTQLNRRYLLSVLLCIICHLGALAHGDLIILDESVTGWSNLTTSSAASATGTVSASWTNFGTAASVVSASRPTVPFDLGPYDTVSFWMYSGANVGAKFRLIANTDSTNYFILTRGNVTVDWVGWRHFSYNLNGSTKTGSPNWRSISSIAFENSGNGMSVTSGASVYLDDLRLSQASTAECVLLDENISAWSGLTSSTTVKTRGSTSGAFTNFGSANGNPSLSSASIPLDWKRFHTLSFWAYSPQVQTAKFKVYVECAGGYLYTSNYTLDWSGWKLFSLPISSLAKNVAAADVTQVKSLKFFNYGWGMSPVAGAQMNFDDIRLEGPSASLLDENISGWTNAVSESSSTYLRKGVVSAKWNNFTTGSVLRSQYPDVPTNWTNYNRLAFWMYCSDGSLGAKYKLTITAGSGTAYYYQPTITLDWTGWKRFEYKLSSFGSSDTTVSWANVKYLTFNSSGWGMPSPQPSGVAVYVDAVELARPQTYMTYDWAAILSAGAASTDTDLAFTTLINDGVTRASNAIYIRYYSWQSIPANLLDSRVSSFPDDHPNKNVFALAMSDSNTFGNMREQLTRVALAARHLNNQTCINHVNAQLSEITGYSGSQAWRAFQRPGWTKYDPANYTALPAGGDGVWLATGWGIEAITATLDIMGSLVPSGLRTACEKLLREEADLVVDSWEKDIPWFFTQTPQSNQWVAPITGLLQATVRQGALDSAYSLGVTNSLAAINAQGLDGAYFEGYAYADQAVPDLFRAALALNLNGLMDLKQNRFFQGYGKWYLAQLMPGNYLLNAYDCGIWNWSRPFSSYILANITTDQDELYWAYSNFFPGRSIDNARDRLVYHYLKRTATTAPTPYAMFPTQNLVSWRSSWSNTTAKGLWAKGSSAKDQHNHDDVGQVCFYSGSDAILIEAGTPSYGNPDIETKYQSCAGHSVLQATDRSGVQQCQMTVNSLDANGGSIDINATPAYTDVTSWTRGIDWGLTTVAISDSATLTTAKTSSDEWFRLHTGSTAALTITGSGSNWTASWAKASISFAANKPITLSQVEWVNNSLPAAAGGTANAANPRKHYCLIIKTASSSSSLDLTTTVTLSP